MAGWRYRPRRHGARIGDARGHAAEGADRAGHLFEVAHRGRDDLQDEAVVARDVMGLHDLRCHGQQLVQAAFYFNLETGLAGLSVRRSCR